METIFLKILNMSITAGWLIPAVILLRLVLKRAPKAITCALWLIVAVRLICPFCFESMFSLIPSAETVSPDILYSQLPVITSGIHSINSAVNPVITASLAPEAGASVNPLQILTVIASYIWLVGAVSMLGYGVVSYLRIRGKVREGSPLRDNIWLCDHIATPFILGIFRPRIYLPSAMEDTQSDYVIAHENAHLKRRDHWWKPLGYLLLAVYWFNPLCWVAYILLCRDIELACDEKVIRSMKKEDMLAYSETLLACSIPRRMVMACPLAFGEVSVKERIKTMLNYKKPAFWVIVVAVLACIVMALCFLTNPTRKPSDRSLKAEAWPLAQACAFENQVAIDREKVELVRPEEGKSIEVRYPLEGSEGCIRVSFDMDGNTITSASTALEKPALSLNDVIILSGKGKALTWSDFNAYPYAETGSGLYIRVYDINSQYSLRIGGGPTDEPPMYIRLVSKLNTDDYIDIRTESVMDFIEAHRLDMLDQAVNEAALEHNSGRYEQGDFACEAHVILGSTSGQDEKGVFITAYVVVKYQVYARDGETYREVAGQVAPAAITFDVTDNSTYSLREYWESANGAYCGLDLRDKFPENVLENAISRDKYLEELARQCDAQAQAHYMAE